MDYVNDSRVRIGDAPDINSVELSTSNLKVAYKKEVISDHKAKKLYDDVSFDISKQMTIKYSTSFSIGVRCLNLSIRNAVYSIYAFVRLADEIVDSFHHYNQVKLLDDFEREYYQAMNDGISLNPILNSFQHTVKKHGITDDLVQAFIKSMRADLYKKEYNELELKQYIYGSADVVGLMCLKVFVNGNDEMYQALKLNAKSLGSAFQKVNFLRDLKDDHDGLDRIYFPQLRDKKLTEETKHVIIEDINKDYRFALSGLRELPDNSRLGVYIAYTYYKELTNKITNTTSSELMKKRIRVSGLRKIVLLVKAFIIFKLGWI